MLATPPLGASSNKAPLEGQAKPPVELVVGDLDTIVECKSLMKGLTLIRTQD